MDGNELAEVFNDSYERVMKTPEESTEFFSAFYALLMANSDEAASKFRNTNMEKQVRMMHASVSILLAYHAMGSESDYLRKLAGIHSKQDFDIPPRLYTVWLDCLIATVGRFDSEFNDDVATAWRDVFSKGIEFMTSRYEAG